MPKRNRPSAWAIAKAAQQMRKPYSKGGKGWGNKRAKVMVVPGFTRTGGPYKRALMGRPGGITLGGTIEKKYYDTGYSATFSSAGAIISDLLAIAQGTTEVTRVGGKINVTNFNLRGRIDGLQTSGTVSNTLRVILFWDKQTNGAAPAVTDVLKQAGVNEYMNMDNVDRFQIIKDKFIVSNLNAAFVTPVYFADSKILKFNYKCSVPIHYSSTTGAIAEIKSNNLCLLLISDTSASHNYTFRVRTKFTDA